MPWGYCGPKLMTALVDSYCPRQNSYDRIEFCRNLSDVTLLPEEAIQPIKYEDIFEIFKPIQKSNELFYKKVRSCDNMKGIQYIYFSISDFRKFFWNSFGISCASRQSSFKCWQKEYFLLQNMS